MITRTSKITLAAAFVGWFLCFVTMGVAMAALPLDDALLVHAAAAPLIFGAVSLVYFSRWGYMRPLATAAVFVGFVMAMDFVLVAVLINRSLAMFASPIGTWIPFSLIFAATYLTGTYLARNAGSATSRASAADTTAG